MKHMYFGSDINSEKKSEYWHKTLWEESLLFEQNRLSFWFCRFGVFGSKYINHMFQIRGLVKDKKKFKKILYINY